MGFDNEWDDIFNRIKIVVIDSIWSVQDKVESRPNCFELYGFDLVLD